MSSYPKTLNEAIVYFADEEKCVQFLKTFFRWSDGVTCPHCLAKDETHIYLSTVKKWKCRVCRKQFSITKGTIFEHSKIPLSKWLPCIWMLVNSKRGVSSCQISRDFGLTQATAWFMLHRIREIMGEVSNDGRFEQEVEVDETWIGGKFKNAHAEKRERNRQLPHYGKSIVVGILQRDGEVELCVIDGIDRETLQSFVRKHVKRGSTVYTDGLPSYLGLDKDYKHKTIDHNVCYAKGEIHINGIENFWSHLKKTLGATYISVAPYHLWRYLEEQAFRFNRRTHSDLDRFLDAIRNVCGRRLTYLFLITESDRRKSNAKRQERPAERRRRQGRGGGSRIRRV